MLLTGATEGIGKAAARALAGRGATLGLVGRDAMKTDRLVSELQAASGNPHIEALVADLSRLEDVRALASAFQRKHDRLDVLINNAGGLFTERVLTPDGFERTFALNHLAYFLLTHELLELLAKTPGARVVNTASGAHRGGNLSDLNEVAKRERSYAPWKAYADSKLANILFTRELARRVRDRGIVANCFHPGFVRTGFGRNNPGSPIALLLKLGMSLIARTPEKGAETLVWLATSPEAGRISGEYFHDRRIARVVRSFTPVILVGLVVAAFLLGRVAAIKFHLHGLGNLAALLLAGISAIGLPRRHLEDLQQKLWRFSAEACRL